MTADIDIYRAAKLYIDQHGDQPALQAATQASFVVMRNYGVRQALTFDLDFVDEGFVLYSQS